MMHKITRGSWRPKIRKGYLSKKKGYFSNKKLQGSITWFLEDKCFGKMMGQVLEMVSIQVKVLLAKLGSMIEEVTLAFYEIEK